MHIQWLAAALALGWAGLAWIRLRDTRHAFGPVGVAGLALALYPACRVILAFTATADLLFVPTVLRPASSGALWSQATRTLTRNLVWPLLGLALAYRFAPWAGRLVCRLRDAFDGPAVSARAGLALVPLVAGAQILALMLLAGPASVLQTGDESAYFSNAHAGHVLALSAGPGIGEELYYRGVLMLLLVLFLRPAWAVGGQALVFAVAHSGFGTLSHVLGPLAFGLFQGFVVWRFGLPAAMVLHAGTNLAFFAVDPGAGTPPVQAMALVLMVVGLVALWFERHRFASTLKEGLQRARGTFTSGS